jgi:hypothetical protein
VKCIVKYIPLEMYLRLSWVLRLAALLGMKLATNHRRSWKDELSSYFYTRRGLGTADSCRENPPFATREDLDKLQDNLTSILKRVILSTLFKGSFKAAVRHSTQLASLIKQLHRWWPWNTICKTGLPEEYLISRRSAIAWNVKLYIHILRSFRQRSK